MSLQLVPEPSPQRPASLDEATDLLRLLGDPTRVRLLRLLGEEELSVAELVRVTRLPQPRVSTHLAKLREAGLVSDRKSGTASFYRFFPASAPLAARRTWEVVRGTTSDALLEEDAERVAAVLRERSGSWAEAVAGQMERHYSPGRTWESALHGLLGLAEVGHVLDIASGDGAIAQLLAPRAQSVTCLDQSARVLAAAGRRLRQAGRVELRQADMHELPFADGQFDQVLMMHALSYARDPERALAEAARVLRPGGRLAAVTLGRHRQREVATRFGHVQLGFEADDLRERASRVGLCVDLCEITTREKRRPHFEVLTLHAGRPREAEREA